jgi:hypothetical protein
VEARCPGLGFVATERGPEALSSKFHRLETIAARGRVLCLTGPFEVQLPGIDTRGREYAGIFIHSPPPPFTEPTNGPISEGQRRARTGSSFLFRTTLARYTAGVLRSEDASIKGEPRAALARVIAHNQSHSRHPGRPVCDTTHCQVFQGTVSADPTLDQTLQRPPLPTTDWLNFSQGGTEPWEERRTAAQLQVALGPQTQLARIEGARVHLIQTKRSREGWIDEGTTLQCETLRSRLKLPACPTRFRLVEGAVVFEGQGRGHGVGLDVERAKKSKLSQDELLKNAYAF